MLVTALYPGDSLWDFLFSALSSGVCGDIYFYMLWAENGGRKFDPLTFGSFWILLFDQHVGAFYFLRRNVRGSIWQIVLTHQGFSARIYSSNVGKLHASFGVLCFPIRWLWAKRLGGGPLSVVVRAIRPPFVIWVCGGFRVCDRHSIWDSLRGGTLSICMLLDIILISGSHVRKLRQPSLLLARDY